MVVGRGQDARGVVGGGGEGGDGMTEAERNLQQVSGVDESAIAQLYCIGGGGCGDDDNDDCLCDTTSND